MDDQLGVIFDVDGVLVDSYRAHFASWNKIAVKHGLTMDEADFRTTFGRRAQEIIHHLWPGKFDDAGLLKFDEEKEQAYREILKKDFPEMNGASNLIAALHEAGFYLAIGSSGPPENVALVKNTIRNGQWFTATVNRDDVTRGKPDPQVFLVAAKKLGLAPSKCAVVEDAVAGVQAARAAGMVAVGLTGTADRTALLKYAHFVVDSLTELNADVFRRLIESGGRNG